MPQEVRFGHYAKPQAYFRRDSKEIGGYLALLLNRQEALSERQTLRLAAYLVGYSESMVEKRYREKKKGLKAKDQRGRSKLKIVRRRHVVMKNQFTPTP